MAKIVFNLLKETAITIRNVMLEMKTILQYMDLQMCDD